MGKNTVWGRGNSGRSFRCWSVTSRFMVIAWGEGPVSQPNPGPTPRKARLSKRMEITGLIVLVVEVADFVVAVTVIEVVVAVEVVVVVVVAVEVVVAVIEVVAVVEVATVVV